MEWMPLGTKKTCAEIRKRKRMRKSSQCLYSRKGVRIFLLHFENYGKLKVRRPPSGGSEADFLNLGRELCTSYARVSHQLPKMGFLKISVHELSTRWRSSQSGFFKLCAWVMLDICMTSLCTELVLIWGSHKSNIENFNCYFCYEIVSFRGSDQSIFFGSVCFA